MVEFTRYLEVPKEGGGDERADLTDGIKIEAELTIAFQTMKKSLKIG